MSRSAETFTGYYFLQGGGATGALLRKKVWSKTSLGEPAQWPESLRAMVAMVLANPAGSCIVWGADYLQLYNDAYASILGNTKHPRALGASARETFAGIWHVFGTLLEEAMAGNATAFPDLPLLGDDSPSERYYDCSFVPVRKEDGAVGGVLVTVVDTTARRHEHEALKQSEARFRALADNSPNLVWMADPGGWIFWYNKRWYDYTGTTPEQMEGWGWQSVHDPAELPRVLDKWKESIATGKQFEMVFPLKGADGRYKHFLTRVMPGFKEDGRIYQWFGTNTDITDRINAEEAIKESEQRFRTMAEGTDILIATSDETSNATYFNKAWSDLTGRSMEDLVNFGWADLLHEEDRQAFVDLYLRSFEKQIPWTGEFRMLDKNGTYRWLLARGPVRRRPDGSFAGYISSSIEITARKLMEERLVKSEQQVRSLIESAPFPIGVYVGNELRIEFANQAILDAWGKSASVIGKPYREALPELAGQNIYEQMEEVLSTGVPFHAKNQAVDLRIGGTLRTFYFNYSITPLRDSLGNVYGVMSTGADVTDLNLAKQKVEQSEANFRNMILQSPVAMCILMGPSHVVEIANDSMIALFGRNKSDVMNKPVFEALPFAQAQGLEQLLAHVYVTGETFKANERPVELIKNGILDTAYLNFTYEPYKDADGATLGVLAIAIDVTEQVQARQKIEDIVSERTKALALANSDLKRSNAELAQFAYIASHDLQEPLRKISTYSQMLENKLQGSLNELTTNYLNKINSASSRMNRLIRDVLTYSELTRADEVFSSVDLNRIVENILTDYELLIEQKQASIRYRDLPTIDAIPLQMFQLFGNLIANALKFSKKDVKPVIDITSTLLEHPPGSGNPDHYRITCTDNGIGFKPEYAERIFNIFQRLHRKSEYDGTGIGLAMCKKIVENHGGEINAAGSSESGAVFNITLPATHARSARAADAAVNRVPQQPPASISNNP